MVALRDDFPSTANVHLVTEFRGAAGRLWTEHTGEIIISGPAGTGKTRSILEWVHHRCANEKIRVLFLRKTLESLKVSAMVTYTNKVLHDFDGKQSRMDGVSYFGGNSILPSNFTYQTTGSVIVMGGMDNPTKVLSTEYDLIYINEATELTLDQWERLGNRTDRPDENQDKKASLLLGDCNPDAPTHWIKTRERDGKLRLWPTVHEDNPAMWDRHLKQWTRTGKLYLDRLELLTGVRYLRLRKGLWVAAEGQVYENWNPSVHLVPVNEIPYQWPRFWVIDFGFVHPFVWQAWAWKPDGELVMYHEIYMTRRLVSQHARRIMEITAGEPRPTEIITDHDAEDRATFEAETGYSTTPAIKNVSAGIQAVSNRLGGTQPGSDLFKLPRISYMRNVLDERDGDLADRGKPTSTVEEYPSYIWNLGARRNRGEEPMKEFDHGMDATRYLVAYFDLNGNYDDESDDVIAQMYRELA
jgi:PBSX family phage terminase large subunit